MKDLHHGARELSVRSEQIASKRLCCKQPGSRTFDFNDDEATSGVLSNQEVSDSFAFTTQHRSADIGLLLDNDKWKLERKTENKWIGLKKVLSGSFFQIFSKHGLHAINQFVEDDLLDNRFETHQLGRLFFGNSRRFICFAALGIVFKTLPQSYD